MDASIRLPYRLHLQLVELAARSGASVESVLSLAVVAYIADVDLGLLTRPRETPKYQTRLASPVDRPRHR